MEKGDNGGKLGWILNFSQVTDFIIFEKVNAGEGGNDGGRGTVHFLLYPVLGKQEEKVLFPPTFPLFLFLSLSATMPCIVSLLFLAEYIAASNPNGGTR